MRVKKIMLGVAAVAATAVLAACSTGTSAQSADSAGNVQLAAGHGGVAAAPASTPKTSSSAAAPSTPSAPSSSSRPPAATPVRPSTQSAPAPAVAPGVPCHITTGACVVLSQRKAWIVQDGRVIYGPVSIMPGKPSYPTPTGTFHVLSKVVNYRSREFNNAPMPYAVFFYPGDAFHVGSLGVYSHGCIHLSWSSAKTFYSDLSIGETVQILH